MRLPLRSLVAAVVGLIPAAFAADLPLPPGWPDTDNLSEARREQGTERARISLNGLWRFYPVPGADVGERPKDGSGWGWFKVPGVWPKLDPAAPNSRDAQVPLLPKDAPKIDWKDALHAWYERGFTVPPNWAGKRVVLEFGMVNSVARIWVDGREVGTVKFPGSELDITKFVQPGKKQRLTVQVSALPFEAETLDFMGPDAIFKSTEKVELKGLTGDVFLHARPTGTNLGPVLVLPSVAQGTLQFQASVADAPKSPVQLEAILSEQGKETGRLRSEPLTPDAEGRVAFTAKWSTDRLWDIDTPQNLVETRVRLLDADGKVLDETLPFTFGFRDFTIKGRDFYLNGKRIHLRALLLSNYNAGADLANAAAARRTIDRLREFGFNSFITKNYRFKPGYVTHMDGLLNAARETGTLVAFTLPHATDYQWKLDDPARARAYRDLVRWILDHVGNNPAIVLYAMNSNSIGYNGDQNPLSLDGSAPPDFQGTASVNVNRRTAMVAQGIAKELDPTRPVYHHASGYAGDIYTINNYLNWAPIQERSDYLIPWSKSSQAGPLFPVEWGMPHIASWSSYRGPEFIWRIAAYQHLWDSEFAAPFRGQEAYRMTPLKRELLDLEKSQLEQRGKTGYPTLAAALREHVPPNYGGVQQMFMDKNWRAFRALGLTAVLPWDQEAFWTGERDRTPRDNPDARKNLQQPGIVPDRLFASSQALYHPFESGVTTTGLGETVRRWSQPVIAYLGGRPDHVTEQSHNVAPGGSITRSVVLVNDSRQSVTAPWILTGPGINLSGEITAGPGDVTIKPVEIQAPTAAGPAELTLSVKLPDRTETDRFALHVVAPAPVPTQTVRLFDPAGQTAKLFRDLGIPFESVTAAASPDDERPLVIGREALTPDQPVPLLQQLPAGVAVLVFEQNNRTLTERFHFRTQEYGLRNLHLRAAHPATAGLLEDHLRDWAGASTLLPDYLDGFRFNVPTVRWNGFENTRVWRMGNTGNVASVLIEKPDHGDFLALADGGFDLQYAPILQYTDTRGVIVFCQLDVSGRTARDPAADRLVRQLVTWLADWKPTPAREIVYAGDAAVRAQLERQGITPRAYSGGVFPKNGALVLGPGSGFTAAKIAALPAGTPVLALGLGEQDLVALGVPKSELVTGATYPSFLESFDHPLLRGASNAENYWRVAPEVTAFRSADPALGTLLASRRIGNHDVLFCQAGPWLIDSAKQPMLRTTERRQNYLLARLLHNLGAVSAPSAVRAALGTPPTPTWLDLTSGWVGRPDRDDAGRRQEWFRPDFTPDAEWKPVLTANSFDGQRADLIEYDGLFWYRNTFDLPAGLPKESLTLDLGKIDDESWVWLNGHFLGEVTEKTHPQDYYKFVRRYAVKPEWLKPTGNVLVVLVKDLRGHGGLVGLPALLTPNPWPQGPYLQKPEAIDDPYRYYRW